MLRIKKHIILVGPKLRVFVVCGLFAVMGTVFLLLSHAQVSSTIFQSEAENATAQLPATIVTSGSSTNGASNGGYLQFGSSTPPNSGISVSGPTLLKDGQDFIPKGFNMVALVASSSCNPATPRGARAAWERAGNPELQLIKDTWKANTLRFQVSQPGLATGDTTYLNRLKAGVAQARTAGMVVILSMQDQPPACGKSHNLPTQDTATAWLSLANTYKSDPYVMFELFNEPHVQPRATPKPILPTDAEMHRYFWGANTNELATDCYTDALTTSCLDTENSGDAAVGVNTIIAQIRGTGASNVLIIDGSPVARVDVLFNRADTNDRIIDSQNAVVYAVHPYYFHQAGNAVLFDPVATKADNDKSDQLALWDKKFVTSSMSVPVIATEWDVSGTSISLVSCQTGSDDAAPLFLDYLRLHNIGITAHAFDVPNTMNTMGDVTDSSTWFPTNTSSWTCPTLQYPIKNDAGGDILKLKFNVWQ